MKPERPSLVDVLRGFGPMMGDEVCDRRRQLYAVQIEAELKALSRMFRVDPDIKEEAIQEVMAKLLETHGSSIRNDNEASARGWLRTVLLNRIRDILRKRSRDSKREVAVDPEEYLAMPDGTPGIDDALAQGQHSDELRRRLADGRNRLFEEVVPALQARRAARGAQFAKDARLLRQIATAADPSVEFLAVTEQECSEMSERARNRMYTRFKRVREALREWLATHHTEDPGEAAVLKHAIDELTW